MQWIKLYAGTASDPKFALIAEQTKTHIGDCLGAWLIILEWASKARGDASALPLRMIELTLKLKRGKAEAIVAAMNELGMLDGMIVCAWSERQSMQYCVVECEPESVEESRPLTSTERSRAYRERKRNADATQCNADATQCNADATQCNADATQCNADATQCNADATEGALHIPIDIKNKIKNKSEDLNPPTPQRGEAAGKKATGDSLPELRKAMSDYAGDNAELADALEEFRKMRERIRKPLTGHALKLTMRRLDELAGADERLKIAIVEQSIQRSWQGVFRLDEQAAPRSRASPQADDPGAKTWRNYLDLKEKGLVA